MFETATTPATTSGALPHELFGKVSAEAGRRAHKLLHQLRHGKQQHVVKALEQRMLHTPSKHVHAEAILEKTANAFTAHKNHMPYNDPANQGVPIGSGAMKCQCSQFQNRLERRGPFWRLSDSEPWLAVIPRAQNGERQALWAA